MKVHGIAVVGCGAIARGWHCPSVRDNPRARLVAACDRDESLARACAEQFGAPWAGSDWRAVLADPAVDAIVLATHTNLRAELIVPALEAGKPVFCEKPLANTTAEMEQIAEAVRRTGAPVTVCHNRRSSPAILELRRLVHKARSGPGGWIPSVDRSDGGRRPGMPEERQTQILMRVNDDVRSWVNWIFSDAEGILFAEMVHFIDVALWLNPTPIVRVLAEGSERGNFTLVLRFADGSLTTIQHTLCGHLEYPKELMEVTVNHVTMAMDHHVEVRQRGLADEPFRTTYRFKNPLTGGVDDGGIEGFNAGITAALEHARAAGTPMPYFSPDKGHAMHLDRFLDHIEGRGENPCDVESAILVTKVALRLLESIRAQKALEMQ